MSGLVLALIAVLALWMAACAWCGFGRRIVLFLGVLLGGLALNMTWMMLGLDAKPLEHHALVAQGAATLYALCAFGCGWFAGRIAQAWRATCVDDMARGA